MWRSSHLPSLSRSLSYPYGKKTSPLFQQQHKPEGKGESEAVARTSPLPPGQCWWPGWELWAALRVSSKAGAVAGGRDGGRKRAAGSRKLATAAPGIPACWKPESRFLRRAGSASAPSSACHQAGCGPGAARLLLSGMGAKLCSVASVLSVGCSPAAVLRMLQAQIQAAVPLVMIAPHQGDGYAELRRQLTATVGSTRVF